MNSSKLTVVVTRSVAQSSKLLELLVDAGFNSLAFPVLKIVPSPLSVEIRELLQACANEQYDWIVFSSANAVRAFASLCLEEGVKVPESCTWVAQGPKTAAEVKKLFSREPDFLPDKSTAENLVELCIAKGVADAAVLYPRAQATRDVVAPSLRDAGAQVTDVVVYETRQRDPDAASKELILQANPRNLIFTFFSPSAFNNTIESLPEMPEILKQSRIATLGPVSSNAVQDAGYQVFLEAEVQTERGMVEALEKRFQNEA